jgi:hypothetical protein
MRIIFDLRQMSAGPYVRILSTEIPGRPGIRYNLGYLETRTPGEWIHGRPEARYFTRPLHGEISEKDLRSLVGDPLVDEVLPGLPEILMDQMEDL